MSTLKEIFTVLLLVTFIIPNAYSQSVESNKQPRIEPRTGEDYAMLIRKMNHLKAATKTVGMIEEKGNIINQFEVVICGKSVTKLNDKTKLVKKAAHMGITLSACGMSLQKFSVSKDELPEEIGVVANGLIRMFDLQEQGYKTITL